MKVDDRSNSNSSNKTVTGRKMQKYIHVNIDSATENFRTPYPPLNNFFPEKYPAFVEYNMKSINPKKKGESSLQKNSKLSSLSIKRSSLQSSQKIPTARDHLVVNSTSRKREKFGASSVNFFFKAKLDQL